MKNAVIFGLIIGILSGLWIWAMYQLGYTNFKGASSIEYSSALIPIIGLYFGVRRYRNVDKAGNISFFEALQECFKILLAGGIVAVAIAILFVTYVAKASVSDFAGKIFAALLVGVISGLAVSLLLMTRTNKIDTNS